MAEARQRLEWAIGCEVVAAIYNVNRGDNEPINGRDLNPFIGEQPRTKEQQDAEARLAIAMWRGTIGD
jgi:hypothetical protein